MWRPPRAACMFPAACSRSVRATLTVNDQFDWTGGGLSGPATTTVTGTLTISGGGTKSLGDYGNNGHTLINNGTANFSGGTLYMVESGTGDPAANITNNGTFHATDDADILPYYYVYGGSQPSFTNNGTFTKSGAGTATEMSVAFNNVGTVNVDSGLLNLSAAERAPRRLCRRCGCNVIFWRQSHARHELLAQRRGRRRVLQWYDRYRWRVQRDRNDDGQRRHGELQCGGHRGQPRTFRRRACGRTGTLTVNDQFDWTGGTLSGAATTTVTGTLTISGGNNKSLGEYGNNGHTLINNGTANFSGGTLYMVRQWHGRSRREHHQQRHLPRHRRRRHPPVLLRLWR